MSDEELEAFCDKLLEEVDAATAPEKMGLMDAVEAWRRMAMYLHNALHERINAGNEDLDFDD